MCDIIKLKNIKHEIESYYTEPQFYYRIIGYDALSFNYKGKLFNIKNVHSMCLVHVDTILHTNSIECM